MGEQLENAASVFVAERNVPALIRLGSDPAVYRGLFAPHFVAEGNRRLTGGMPDRNRAEFFSYMEDWFDMAQPASIRADVVAVRGERLAVTELIAVTTDSYEFRLLQVSLLTPDLDQYEWIGTYEPEQLDEALAELERQHSAIIGDDED